MKKIHLLMLAAGLMFFTSCQTKPETASIVLNQESIEVPADGGQTTVGVKSNRNWTAHVDEEWVSLSPSSAEAFEASSYMIITVQANNDLPRTATVTVSADSGEASAILTISQGEDGLVIKNADQFVAAMTALSSPETAKDYRIGKDLDLSGKTIPVIPVLSNILDGQGHTISNWTSSTSLCDTIAAGAAVKGLVFDSSCKFTMNGEDANFGFVAKVNEGTIENVTNKANVVIEKVSKGYKGVICGESKGSIKNCSNTGSVTFEGDVHTDGSVYFGAIAGRTVGESVKAEACSNSGEISFKFNGVLSQSAYVAGVLGAVNSNSKVLKCENSGNLSLKVLGSNTNAHIAGIVCYAGGEVGGCVNKGNVSLRSESADGMADGGVKGTGVAGVATYVGWSGNNVTDNHNYGDITFVAGFSNGYQTVGSATKYSSNVAGVFGHAYKCGIINSNNEGTVSSTFGCIEKCPTAGFNTTARQSVGGIIASSWGVIENCTNKGNVVVDWRTSTHNAGLAKNFVAQIGGINGGDYHSDQISAVIRNCTNEGNLNIVCDAAGANNAIGGISGWPTKENATGKSVENSVNKGNITVDGFSKSRIGGISGGAATHKSNVNHGKVYLKGGAASCAVGGIAGFMNFLNIDSCENYGDVVSDVKLAAAQSSASSAAGGLVGAVGNTEMTYTNCKINCGLSAPTGSNVCMLVGAIGHDKSGAKAFTVGTEEKPVYVKGSLCNTVLTSENLDSAIKAANYTGINTGVKFFVKLME